VVTLVAPKVSVLITVGSVLVVAGVVIVAVPGLIGLIVVSVSAAENGLTTLRVSQFSA
jgi:hypothetical protein